MNNLFRLAQVFWAYKKGIENLQYHPLRLWIEPTNHCNLRCKMCPQGQDGAEFKKGFMDLNLFQKMIQEVALFRADVNLFMGGESLLHPQINEMIAYCKEQGVPSRLYSNATLLDEEKSEKIIRAGLDHITFSFDGIDRKTYEEYRKGAKFENTLENIRTFLKTKRGLGANKTTVVIQSLELQDTSSSRTIKKEFQELFDTKMVDRFTFIQPHSFAGVYKTEGLLEKKKRHYSPCAFLWYSMSVIWDGTVVPCCIDVFRKYPIGNVNEHSLRELWNAENLMKLRKLIYQGHFSRVPLCCECDVLWKRRFLGIPTKSFYNFIEMMTHRI